MEDLCSDLCYEQPQNINEFLVERLKVKQKQGISPNIQASKLASSANNRSSIFSLSLTSRERDLSIRKGANRL